MRSTTIRAIILATLALAAGAHAQTTSGERADHAGHAAAPAGGAADPSQAASDGEVRKVDVEARKLTLRHGPIPSLEMPGMTMVFQVRDARMLDGLKPGDKVTFKADKVGGQYTVTELNRMP